jgi:N-methylhydantoinase B
MATMAGGFATTTAAAVCLARMLAASRNHRNFAMATWSGATGAVDVFGADQWGQRFGTVLLDTMAGGAGARASKDGIDTGGFLRSMACVITNVELYESRYPILYLYRRQEPDTGGPGVFRGGVGIGYAIVGHKTDHIERVNPHFSGSDEPESVGIAGGYPGGANRVALLVNTDAKRLMARGTLVGPNDLGGVSHQLPGVAVVKLKKDDVLLVSASGGGGWGDPILREPGHVLRDIREGTVSEEWARLAYGVELGEGMVDARRTATRRSRIRSARRRAANREDVWEVLGEFPQFRNLRCPNCDVRVGKPAAALRRLGLIGPKAGSTSSFRLVELYCPNCWSTLAVDRRPRESVPLA